MVLVIGINVNQRFHSRFYITTYFFAQFSYAKRSCYNNFTLGIVKTYIQHAASCVQAQLTTI